MKKSLTGVVALLAGAFVAHSQGTVEFANYAVAPAYTYVTLNGTKLGGAATHTGNSATDTGVGSDWTVALYGAAAGGTPAQLLDSGGVPVTSTLEVNNALLDVTAGTWYSTAVGVVPNTPNGAGSAATVQVYAWYNDNNTYGSYTAAQTAGVPTGFSPTVAVTTGGPGSPPAVPVIPQFSSFSLTGGSTVTPEPNTIALGVMGASAFLLRLRKKQ